MAYCTKCGNNNKEGMNYCNKCGSPLVKEVEKPLSVEKASEQKKIETVEKKSSSVTKKELKKASKNKGKKNGFLKFLLVMLIILTSCGLLFGAWFAFSNMITLSYHSKDVVKTISSGSLDLPGNENEYSNLPDYIKDAVDNKELFKDTGPVTGAILPYVSAEVQEVHGFFGASKVDYIIYAPDVESWLLSYEMTENTTDEQFIADLSEYVKTAPKREAQVTVEYYKDGIFSFKWRGNYKSREFMDAVCGGFNTAYNEIYQNALEEMEELLK